MHLQVVVPGASGDQAYNSDLPPGGLTRRFVAPRGWHLLAEYG